MFSKIVKLLVMSCFLHDHCDQRSQVSRVTLWCQKLKLVVCTELLSDQGRYRGFLKFSSGQLKKRKTNNAEKLVTWNVKTLKAVGRDLFDRQCEGNGEHNMHGDPV